MYINSIILENFRNYKDQTINLNENINIIHGNNAQGKTNIIDKPTIIKSEPISFIHLYNDFCNNTIKIKNKDIKTIIITLSMFESKKL